MANPPSDRLLGLPFDLYTRSKLAADFIHSLSGAYGRLKVLDAGGRKGRLRDFLDEIIDVYILDRRGPEDDSDKMLGSKGKYIVGDILHAPIPNTLFDVVVSLDVLEHLEDADRLEAVKEMLRVSRLGIVAAAPFDSPLTDEAERRLNDYFKRLTGRDHPWLKEHLEARPLPSREAMESFLKANHLTFTAVGNNNVELWTELQYLVFTAYQFGIDLDEVYRLYNTNYEGLGDAVEPTYRRIYFVAKESRCSQYLPRNSSGNNVAHIAESRIRLADTMFQAVASGAFSSLLAKDRHIANLEGHQRQLQLSVTEKDKTIAELTFHLLALQRTIGWKCLERVRRVRDRLFPPDSRRGDLYGTFRRVVEVFVDEGSRAVFRKTEYKIRQACRGHGILVKAPRRGSPQDLDSQYEVFLARHRLTPQDMEQMRDSVKRFTYTPFISIVTPVYNTHEAWLRRAIESVRSQIYPNWELCLVNDASTEPRVSVILDEYAATDPRLKVKQLPRNEGIAGSSAHALELATGEFVGLLDHDDELSPDALFEVAKRLNEDPRLDLLYSDEDKLEPDGRHVEPFFKPDWSPDLLLSMNYIAHFSVFRRSLLDKVGGFKPGFDGSQDYDLLLRFTERTDRIGHVSKVLYHWRKSSGSAAASTAAKPYAYEAARRAIKEALRRRRCDGHVETIGPGRYLVRYRLAKNPLVSIIVPTRDQWQVLRQCLDSVEEKTSYSPYEIIVLDNDSRELETLSYLDTISRKWRVWRFPGPFNFSAINNFGASHANGDYLLLLNNDTQVIGADWLTAMLEQAQRPNVGAVGAKLLYPDQRIQHAGMVLGIGGVADHAFKYLPHDRPGYFGLVDVVRNCSGVTAACMMVSRRVFDEIGGFDERFRIALGDVDFCLRLRQHGYLIVYTPLALLYHHESATRGRLHPPEEEALCWKLWGEVIKAGDPYYNPSLTLSREDWTLRL